MKSIIFAVALLVSTSAGAVEYGIDVQKRMIVCTGATIKEAANLDFSRWVLPAWMPGKHLRAGQYLDRDCNVGG